jgi:outer membrane protein OmpA-like peptidoglycan-associated protein
LEAKSKGYYSDRVLVEGNDSSSFFKHDFYLQPIELGTTIILDNITFDFNKASIHPESYPELNLLINFLQEHRNYHAEIAGHTDNVGIEEHNLKLSEARAEAIVNYVVEHGFINRKRLSFVGYGASKPIAANDTEEGKAKNRRVELRIIKD